MRDAKKRWRGSRKKGERAKVSWEKCVMRRGKMSRKRRNKVEKINKKPEMVAKSRLLRVNEVCCGEQVFVVNVNKREAGRQT